MARTRFTIPLSRFHEIPQGVEHVDADTLVFAVLTDRFHYNARDLEVNALPSYISGPDRFQIGVAWNKGFYAQNIALIRLRRVPCNTSVLVKVDPKRKQWVDEDPSGIIHAVDTSSSLCGYGLCGTELIDTEDNDPDLTASATHNRRYARARIEVPTCQKCIDEVAAQPWLSFFVQPYVDPATKRKEQHKQVSKVKEARRAPSVYDKLLLDDSLNPPFVPRVAHVIDPETIDETEDYGIDARTAKIAARIEQARFEEQELTAWRQEMKDSKRKKR